MCIGWNQFTCKIFDGTQAEEPEKERNGIPEVVPVEVRHSKYKRRDVIRGRCATDQRCNGRRQALLLP